MLRLGLVAPCGLRFHGGPGSNPSPPRDPRENAASKGSRAAEGQSEPRATVVRPERDGRAILPVGAHHVPVEGPDWPWRVGPDAFDAAFAQMAEAGLDTVRIDLLWAAVEPEPGRYDETHLGVLDAVLEAARRHGLLLHPTFFIGGEVGDAYWDVPWRAGRQPHRDPELIRLQVDQVVALARRWRGDPAILAWDLTDEPPLWLFPDTTDDEARAWTSALAGALRAADPDHLVTIGTASQEVGAGPFRADVVADELDFTTVHPYPIYAPELYPDGLLGTRMTHAAAFETALAGGAGRPVMLHEYGASSAQFDPGRIADYDRLLAWSALGRGAIGYLAWCWTDAEPAAFGRAPYVRQPHETQFGVTDHTGRLRPRGQVLADLAATIRSIGDELDGLAGDGPSAVAAIPVPHEYVRPYDAASFGLDDRGRTLRAGGTDLDAGPGPGRSFAAGSTASSWPPEPACRSPSRASGSTTAGRRRRSAPRAGPADVDVVVAPRISGPASGAVRPTTSRAGQPVAVGLGRRRAPGDGRAGRLSSRRPGGGGPARSAPVRPAVGPVRRRR